MMSKTCNKKDDDNNREQGNVKTISKSSLSIILNFRQEYLMQEKEVKDNSYVIENYLVY